MRMRINPVQNPTTAITGDPQLAVYSAKTRDMSNAQGESLFKQKSAA
jgi:hypothetical protein